MGAGQDEANKPRLARVMYNLLETVRICAGLLTPFTPATSAGIQKRIGAEACDWESLCAFGGLSREAQVTATWRSSRASTRSRSWPSWRR